MSYFLQDQTEAGPPESGALRYSPVVRASQRRKQILPGSLASYEILVPDLSGELEALAGRVAPGTGNVARRLREPTEEFIHVVSGALRVGLVDGEYLLNPGDSIYFDGASVVTLACASDEEVVWFSVLTPPIF